MTERALRLARRLDIELDQLVRFVAGLTPEQMSASCRDPKGADVAGVLTHLREGVDQFIAASAHLTQGGSAPGPPAPAAGHGRSPDGGHGHGHTTGGEGTGLSASLQAEIGLSLAALRRGAALVVPVVRGLGDARLDVVPPPVPDLADGVMNLEQILDFIADDLAGHLAHLKDAVTSNAPAR